MRSNLAMDVTLLIILFLFFYTSICVLFFHHGFLFHFRIVRILRVGRTLLEVIRRDDPTGRARSLLRHVLGRLFLKLERLRRLRYIEVIFHGRGRSTPGDCRGKRSKCKQVTLSVVRRIMGRKGAICSRRLGVRICPVFIHSKGGRESYCKTVSVDCNSCHVRGRSFLLRDCIVGCVSVLVCTYIIRHNLVGRCIRSIRSTALQTLCRGTHLEIRGRVLSGYLSAVGRRSVCCPAHVGRVIELVGRKASLSARVSDLYRIARCCGRVCALLYTRTSHRVSAKCFGHRGVLPGRVTRR